jgi:hypothetical protein
MCTLSPGNDGDRLPPGTLVFRIGKNAHVSPAGLDYVLGQRKALPEMFQPSGDEERLSVWVEELTIADQAWAIMGCKPANTVVACLTVDNIRAIMPPDHFVPLSKSADQFSQG